MPPHPCKFLLYLDVTLLITHDLLYPKLPVRMWNLTTFRVIHVEKVIIIVIVYEMPMPEASIYKDTSTIFPQHYVRLTR